MSKSWPESYSLTKTAQLIKVSMMSRARLLAEDEVQLIDPCL